MKKLNKLKKLIFEVLKDNDIVKLQKNWEHVEDIMHIDWKKPQKNPFK